MWKNESSVYCSLKGASWSWYLYSLLKVFSGLDYLPMWFLVLDSHWLYQYSHICKLRASRKRCRESPPSPAHQQVVISPYLPHVPRKRKKVHNCHTESSELVLWWSGWSKSLPSPLLASHRCQAWLCCSCYWFLCFSAQSWWQVFSLVGCCLGSLFSLVMGQNLRLGDCQVWCQAYLFPLGSVGFS